MRADFAVDRLFQQMLVLYLDEPICVRAVDYFRAFYLEQGWGFWTL